MFDLVYNIDFEIVSFLFALLLYAETYMHYPRHTRKNRIFRLMAAMVIFTEAFDIASAFSITYAAALPRALNVFISSGYFMCGMFLCFILHYYIENSVIPPDGRSILMRTNKVILVIMEASMAINAFSGYYFSFSAAGEYIHGPLYLLMHVASCWFVLCASVSLAVNLRLLKRSQLISGVFFVLLYFTAVLLQTFLMPDVLIIMPAASAMLIIAIFSLESPDYIQLQKTLHELTETKQQLEASNQKYYNLAYTDLMTGLQNRTAYNIRLAQLGMASPDENIVFMMADLNNLKHLNDNFGHLIGDDAIIRAARLLQTCFSQGYQCYRIGGDEFAVIAHQIDERKFLDDYARFTDAARIQAESAAYPFYIASGYQFTKADGINQALRSADEKMYDNKTELKRLHALGR